MFMAKQTFLCAVLVLSPAAALSQTPGLPVITSLPTPVAYRWGNVAIKAGGFITGIVFSPVQPGLVYLRTDVGGAYRSDNSGDRWTPITDQFGRNLSSYLGIESIAVDPEEAAKVYLAAGMYSAEWGGPAAILRSSNKGRTYQITPMPFKMGGNDDGRGCGERLAVDPNLGSILFFGSRSAGLWMSTDSAATWKRVDTFPAPAKLAGPGEKTGITFVAFDASSGHKGTATPTLFVGVAQSGPAPGGASLYRSRDGGSTWQAVPGTPAGLFPTHMVLDPGKSGYFTFVDAVGPNGMQNGAVMKLSLNEGRWKDVTPLKPGTEGTGKFGFGGLAIDAEKPDTILVATIDRWWPGDTIFRSVDGGKNWKDVHAGGMYSAFNAPWTYFHHETPGNTGWMNTIAIDPFFSGKVMYTTGGGLWGTADITNADTGKPTHWGFPNEGIEETVPIAIVSPPAGAHLLSAIADIGGFRHEDLSKSPKDGFFIDPQLNTNTGIDFAALKPEIVVRVGDGDGKVVRGGYSVDTGVTWKPFSTEPPSSTKGGGTVSIAADGKTLVWVPRNGQPYWTGDWGKSWRACTGLRADMAVQSDRLNPAIFYSFNAATGQLLVSTDAAHSFIPLAAPAAPKGSSAVVAPVPGKEGEIWIAAADEVVHTEDAGKTFAHLKGIAKVYTIGFGAPAPSRSNPSVILNGMIGDQEVIVLSTDSGQSWVRIDDPARGFGWKNAIIGDPRIFGRVYIATGGRGILAGEPAPQPVQQPEAAQKSAPVR